MTLALDYLLFLAKLLTVVALCTLPLLLALRARRRQGDDDGEVTVTRLNDDLERGRLALEAALMSPREFKRRSKAVRKARKAARTGDDGRPRTFVCHFDGDLRATAVAGLRREITAILAVAEAGDEVVIVLESGGGAMHAYGLAASQLDRLRRRADLRLRVVVDRIAASGGYMMACVADEVIAAPFAIIGSIGVVAQLPNFHRLLRKHDIDFELVTAGEFKRTLTVFGENTASGRAKFQAEIDDAHVLFKDFVQRCRPHVDLARVATGEWWFASRALELGLVDRLATSDEILLEAAAERGVFRVRAQHRPTLLERLGARAEALLHARPAP
ncbi:MAG: protease SohB [Gammaproteobacteria bacterium]|nr:protease SohB [Gammaproteobacteria bacterium]MCP5198589.1 protease SohB [Gammaproteobacteria bacterium]